MAQYSRTQLAQITKRARLAGFQFDPKWKCLVCGTAFKRCYDHSEAENVTALKIVQENLQTA